MAFEKHKFSGLQPHYPREEKERRRGNNKLELYVKAQDFLEDSLYKLGIFFSGMTVTGLSNDSLVPRNHHKVLKRGHDLKYSQLTHKFCLFKIAIIDIRQTVDQESEGIGSSYFLPTKIQSLSKSLSFHEAINPIRVRYPEHQ